MWRGDYTAAGQVANEAMERAEQIDSQHIRVMALTIRATVAAYTGRAEDARADARDAIEIAIECGTPHSRSWPTILLGFVEVSSLNYADALTILQPLIDMFHMLSGTEIMTGFVPDAVEAMIEVGRLDEAVAPDRETRARRAPTGSAVAARDRCAVPGHVVGRPR